MLKKILVVASLICVTSLASAYEIQGLTLGQKVSDAAVKKFSKVACEAKDGGKVCNATTTFEGTKGHSIRYILDKDNTVQLISLGIMLDSLNPVDLEKKLTQSFGQPKSVKNDVPFEMDWSDDKGNRIAYSRTSSIALMTLTTKAHNDKLGL